MLQVGGEGGCGQYQESNIHAGVTFSSGERQSPLLYLSESLSFLSSDPSVAFMKSGVNPTASSSFHAENEVARRYSRKLQSLYSSGADIFDVSDSPTGYPSGPPSLVSGAPSSFSTETPTGRPSRAPTYSKPSSQNPSGRPTEGPSVSRAPSSFSSESPNGRPTGGPSVSRAPS